MAKQNLRPMRSKGTSCRNAQRRAECELEEAARPCWVSLLGDARPYGPHHLLPNDGLSERMQSCRIRLRGPRCSSMAFGAELRYIRTFAPKYEKLRGFQCTGFARRGVQTVQKGCGASKRVVPPWPMAHHAHYVVKGMLGCGARAGA